MLPEESMEAGAVALEAEQKAAQEAIRAIEAKTKEAWRKGAGKSAASRMRANQRDLDELAKLKANTMALRTSPPQPGPASDAHGEHSACISRSRSA